MQHIAAAKRVAVRRFLMCQCQTKMTRFAGHAAVQSGASQLSNARPCRATIALSSQQPSARRDYPSLSDCFCLMTTSSYDSRRIDCKISFCATSSSLSASDSLSDDDDFDACAYKMQHKQCRHLSVQSARLRTVHNRQAQQAVPSPSAAGSKGPPTPYALSNSEIRSSQRCDCCQYPQLHANPHQCHSMLRENIPLWLF